ALRRRLHAGGVRPLLGLRSISDGLDQRALAASAAACPEHHGLGAGLPGAGKTYRQRPRRSARLLPLVRGAGRGGELSSAIGGIGAGAHFSSSAAWAPAAGCLRRIDGLTRLDSARQKGGVGQITAKSFANTKGWLVSTARRTCASAPVP